MNKYVVFVTYGVYVESNNEDDVTRLAVEKMLSHGLDEVLSGCDIEIENVTEEFSQ